jgi:hypothetical protein
LTELGWANIPKDLDEQRLRGFHRGHPCEDKPHRKRYKEVQLTMQRIVKVLRCVAVCPAAVLLRGI